MMTMLRFFTARSMRRPPMIFQAEAAECGLACLAMILGTYGRHVTIATLRTRYSAPLQGFSIKQLLGIGRANGLQGRAVQCDLGQLGMLSLPAALHWDFDHMVVLSRVSPQGCVLHDPARGERYVTMTEVSKHYTGIAIEFEPANEAVPPAPQSSGTSGWQLQIWRTDHARAAAGMLALSAVLEAAMLSQPLVLRWLVDRAMALQERALVWQLTGAAAIAAVCMAASMFARDSFVLRVGTRLNSKLMGRLFRHVLSLPLPFFEKRVIGHLLERYRSADDIERTVISTIPLALLDGVTTLISIGLVCWISPRLAAASLLTVLIYLALRHLTLPTLKSQLASLAIAKGDESGHVIETLRGIFSAKANGLETARAEIWDALNSRSVADQVRSGEFEGLLRAARTFLISGNLAAFVAICGAALFDRQLTLGLFAAMVFYNTHFLTRAMTLVDRVSDVRLLSLKLERLDDLLIATPEGALNDTPADSLGHVDLIGAGGMRVQVQGLKFEYSPTEPPIFDDLEFEVRPGEFVLVSGPNGAGKTTLLKLLLALYKPASGKVLIDRTDAQRCIPALRSQTGVVTQSDVVFAGTIAENVSLFDTERDDDRVREVCAIACIHHDIWELPLRYDTQIGGIGSVFSAGQTQRLFIARALYRRPRLLLLDEGTANVDREHEKKLLANLRGLSITTFFIAHHMTNEHGFDAELRIESGRAEILRFRERAEPPASCRVT